MKSQYDVKSGGSHVGTFERKSDAYLCRQMLRKQGKNASVNKHVVFERIEEWDGLAD